MTHFDLFRFKFDKEILGHPSNQALLLWPFYCSTIIEDKTDRVLFYFLYVMFSFLNPSLWLSIGEGKYIILN